jgi:predicted short-subunit dehydrogenase-like oxidoreductase (DUF2520 family)
LAETLGLKPFELADDARPLYHAGAAIASNYLVTLHAVASELFRAAGAPPEGLVPLMRGTIDNGFELTGPIERGDWETVEAHRRAIRAARPELEPLYDVLPKRRQMKTRERSERCARSSPVEGGASGSCRRWARSTKVISPSSAPRATRARP